MNITWLDWLNDLSIFDWLRPEDHPVGQSASGSTWVAILLMIVLGTELVTGIVLGVRYARRDPQRFPPAFVVMLFAFALFATSIEAFGDWAVGVWYSADTPLIAFTMMDRPIPFWVVLLWFGTVPLSVVIGYRMVVTGAPAKRILWVALILGVTEMALETLACNTGLMSYYGYYATVLGVPPSQYTVNGFMYVFIGVALAYLVPWLQNFGPRNWRWLLVVPTIAVGYQATIAFCTPMIIGAALHDYPAAKWAGAIIGTILPAVAAAVLLRSRLAEQVRGRAASPAVDREDATQTGQVASAT